MKIAIHTLGCKVNQYETQALESELLKRGHELGAFDQLCDAYIINTCSVTAMGDKKSRQAVRRAKRTNPSALVAVCGCYSQIHPEEAGSLGADLVSGTNDRSGFISLLEEAFVDKKRIVSVDDPMSRRHFEQLPAGGLSERTRAMLKIEDGCHNFCSYCIIPYTRGPVRSLPADAAVAQAIKLGKAGFREIILTGIEISSYGNDLTDDTDLSTLTSRLCGAVPDLRIRLGSLEPRTITEAFCQRLKEQHNLCDHFHLSLQSGCDDTLMRMRRKYSTSGYLQSVNLLRTHFPGCAITTDLIVGFPGETEEEFVRTLDFIQKCSFASMHIFPYSRRPGTPAASMPGQVKNTVKTSRAARASEIAGKMEQEYLESFVGQTLDVLFESEHDSFSWGHAKNNVSVAISGKILHNSEISVRITRVYKDYVTGVLDK